MGKYEKYIVRKPLMMEEPKFHAGRKLPIFMGVEVLSEAKVTIHGHWRTEKEMPTKGVQVVTPHTHDVDKVYLCLGEPGASEMEVQLGDETYKVECPYSVYVPAGLKHAIHGTKIMKPPVAMAMILLKGTYTGK